ncbi:MAG TPA: hypothetical protein DEB05_12225 [Firmicutes bacterium]|nr:hypothetical protein [Bacillota bacterium]
MIYIITGEINQGKSRKLLSFYREGQKGEGFYNYKIFRDGFYVGQKIIRLTTGESREFSYREGFIPDNWREEGRFKNFSFSKKGLEFGRNIIKNALAYYIEPLFIDEVGPLELQGKGFCGVFKDTLDAGVNAYVVIRKSCLNKVIDMFALKEYVIVDTN